MNLTEIQAHNRRVYWMLRDPGHPLTCSVLLHVYGLRHQSAAFVADYLRNRQCGLARRLVSSLSWSVSPIMCEERVSYCLRGRDTLHFWRLPYPLSWNYLARQHWQEGIYIVNSYPDPARNCQIHVYATSPLPEPANDAQPD